MRIGIFTDTYPPYINGVSTSIVSLEKALKAKGHEVYIVTVNSENLTYKYEDDDHIIRIPGIPTGIYDYRLTGIYPLRAINKIKKWNLDIIHSHTEFGVGTFARIIAKQFNIPLVHTYHTMYEDYVHYITKGYFDKSSKKLAEYFTKFYCDKTAKELIVPSKKTYDLFKEKYKVNKTIHIVPTGIDVEKFYIENQNKKELELLKKELKLKKDDFIITYVGRLAEEKNIEFLIDNHTKLNKKCKLMIVGNGPDLEKFKKMVKKLNLEERVIFTGAVPHYEIASYYAISNIFVTASVTETQGLTVIEAMAASIPVVCADDESFKDAVIDGLNGKVFKNDKEYVSAIEKLYKNKEQYKVMCKQARVTAESHSLKYYAEKILDVYNITIKSSKNESFIDKIKGVIKWKN
mgnify:CR=1 FL=1